MTDSAECVVTELPPEAMSGWSGAERACGAEHRNLLSGDDDPRRGDLCAASAESGARHPIFPSLTMYGEEGHRHRWPGENALFETVLPSRLV